ncbi:hypothetical protein BDW74DRAFT_177803 [Aspergillus multicolor]|uniref:ankyrin repeat protein n=1 Tax=Aspergillus multicolor TaxID=41759 RepID=UPI003CCDBC61
MTDAERNKNTSGLNWPIDELIHSDSVQTLRELHRAGCWDPLGYNVDGQSYLAFTAEYGAWDVFDYIALEAVAAGDVFFATSFTTIEDIWGEEPTTTNSGLLIDHSRYHYFLWLWRKMQNVNARWSLTHDQRSYLAERLNWDDANMLLVGGCDLATINLGLTSGSAWHVAAYQNGKIDFLDFMHQQDPTNINSRAGSDYTPLWKAFERHSLWHFKRLMELGADPGEIPMLALQYFPHHKHNEYFLAMLSYIRIPGSPPNAPAPDPDGTLLHMVVLGLDWVIKDLNSNHWVLTPRQKQTQRTKHMNNAKRLIQLIREGNANGPGPDLSTTDRHGKTALQLAQELGFRALYNYL